MSEGMRFPRSDYPCAAVCKALVHEATMRTIQLEQLGKQAERFEQEIDRLMKLIGEAHKYGTITTTSFLMAAEGRPWPTKG